VTQADSRHGKTPVKPQECGATFPEQRAHDNGILGEYA
jgi:hypothetical protein